MFKKTTKATAHIVEIAIILGVLILVNILTEDVHARWDLTADKQYTLSDESKEVVADLKDELRVTLYSSIDMPTLGKRIIKETKDLIREYDAYANSNFVFREEHPDVTDEEEVQRLAMKGVMPVEVRDYEAAKRETARVYIGMLISYGDQSEAIMTLNDSAGLEYAITRTILKLSVQDVPVIGVFGGAGVDPLSREGGGFSGLGESLRAQYEVMNVDLSTGPVSERVDTLLVLNPAMFGPREKMALDQYIMSGGKTAFFLDTVDIQLEQGLQGRKRKRQTPWADILSHYGFMISPELIVDLEYNKGIPLQGYIFPPPYPLWPKVHPGSFGDLAFTSGLESVTLPWISPVEYTGDPDAEGREVDYIFTSSANSYAMKEPFDINPGTFMNPNFSPPSALSEQKMGVMVKGIFDSYYAGKEIPTMANSEGVPEPVWEGEVLETSLPTEIVVIGCSNVVSDIAVDPEGRSENATFILNMMDSMNLGGGLSRLRSRKVTDRPLKAFEKESEKSFLKFFGIWLIPILLSLFGVGRYILRSQTRKLVEAHTAEMS